MLSCAPVSLFALERIMHKSALLRALQQQIRRHDFNYFVHEPPSIAQGGKGVVVPGCPACMKRINTMSQFLDHLQGRHRIVPIRRGPL